MEVDPDYAGFETNTDEDLEEKRSRLLEVNARDAAVEKIQSIIDEQFSREIEAKESELMTINERLVEARCVMDRLRACVVASFYAASFTKPVDGAKGPDPGAAHHPAIQNVMRKAVTSVLSKNAPPYQQKNKKSDPEQTAQQNTQFANKDDDDTVDDNEAGQSADVDGPESGNVSKVNEKASPNEDNKKKSSPADDQSGADQALGSRRRIKKTIVVGNVSKYIPPEQREGSDKSTHKWMMYVRGDKDEPRIDHFVRKVWFFLHPSYRPNDLVEVCEAPFHLTRRGWGEFPIRVQIHFCDRRNRPVDIIHQLRLDRTYTGLQTLGAETVCKVEIDQSSVQLSVDEMLDVADLSTLPVGDVGILDVKLTNLSERTDHLPVKDEALEPVKENPKEQAVKSSKAQISELNYSGQHKFQPVTTSCTISSDTVSPSRKKVDDEAAKKLDKISEEGSLSKDDREKVDMAADASGGEKAGETASTKMDCETSEKSEIGLVDEEGDAEIRQEEDFSPNKKRRKRRRDSCRVSASEEELDLGPEAKKSTPGINLNSTDVVEESPDIKSSEHTHLDPSAQQTKPNDAIECPANNSNIPVPKPNYVSSEIKSASLEQKPICQSFTSEKMGQKGPAVSSSNVLQSDTGDVLFSGPGVAKDKEINVSSMSENTEKLISTPPKEAGTSTSPQKVIILGRSPGKGVHGPVSISNMKSKPVLLLPRGDKGQVRIRSASDGDGPPGGSCASLIRSGLNVTPVLNVKIHPDASASSSEAPKPPVLGGSPLRKIVPCPGVQKFFVLDTRHVLTPQTPKGLATRVILPPEGVNLPPDGSHKQVASKPFLIPQRHTITIKREPTVATTSDSSSTATNPTAVKQASVAIPLSSLLKAGSISTHGLAGKKPQTLMLTQSAQGPYITLKATGTSLGKAITMQPRQKRSFSADQLPKQSVSLVTTDSVDSKQKSATSGPTSTVEVQILNPSGKQKSTKPTLKVPRTSPLLLKQVSRQSVQGVPTSMNPPTITLQALQAAMSSGSPTSNLVMQVKTEKKTDASPAVKNVKPGDLTGQQQYVLATVVNPQGKQQLALINPSTLTVGGAKKAITAAVKARKSTNMPASVVKNTVGQPKISMKSLKALTGDNKPSQQEAMAILNKLLPDPIYKVIGDSICLENLTSLLEDALPEVAKRVPLVCAKRNITEFPFCALSEADFLEWNLGKQRASEWQRAILVRRVLKYLQNNSKRLQSCQLPSKKFIVNWCLRHGYSVFTDEYEEQKTESKEQKAWTVDDVKNIASTMSPTGDLLKKLDAALKEKISQGKKSGVADSDITEIDVVTVESVSHKQTAIKEEPSEDGLQFIDELSADVTEAMVARVDELKISKEVEAVDEITRKLGFDMASIRGMPIGTMVLAKALQQFAGQVLRKTLANSLVRRDGDAAVQRVAPDEIEVEDVINTFRDTQVLDFFTDKSFAEGAL